MSPKEIRRTWTMTVSLAVGFGLLVLLAVGTVLGIGVYSAARNTIDLMRESASLTSELLQNAIDSHLSGAENQVVHVARAIQEGKVSVDDPEALGRYLHGAIAGLPQIGALVFVDTNYQLVGVGRVMPGHPEPDQTGGFEYRVDYSQDPAVRGAIAQVAKLKKAQWAEVVFRPRYRQTLINLRQPVRKDGKYIGMVVALVAIDELSEFLTTIDKTSGMTSFILQGRDQVVAHRNIRANRKGLTVQKPLPPLASFGDPVLRAIWDEKARLPDPFKLKPPLENRLIEVDGTRYAFLYRTIRGYSDKPWTVGAYVDLDQINAEVRRLIQSSLWGLGALVLAVIIALFLGRRISQPVKRLSVAAEQIGDLRLDEFKPLPGSRISELNHQAAAFNAMVGGLRWFEAYVPKALVRRLMRQSDDETVSSENRQLTALFTDIVGFSTYSEGRAAEEVAAYLNDHFAIVAGCIEAEGGTVDKFIGDSVMAFWGAPEKQKDRAERACRAALAIEAALAADNARRTAEGFEPVRIRIGIHSGEATVGNIGSPGRVNYTVVGDMVNVASRMEQLGKELIRDPRDATILITEATRADLSDGFAPNSLGKHAVKGRAEPIEVYELTAADASDA